MKATILSLPFYFRNISKGLLIFIVTFVAAGYARAQTTFDYQDSIPGFNPFQQTNIGLPKSDPGSLKYYGSGDVNNDGVINEQDVQAIQNGTKNDMADVNGDGVVDSSDAQMLQDYINGTRSYLPGHWNEISALTGANSNGISKRYAARVEWLNKVINIDKTDTNKYINNVFNCVEFSTLFQLNLGGIQNFYNFIDPNGIDSLDYVKYGGVNNRFNISAYRLFSSFNSTGSSGGVQTDPDGHFTDIIFVGSKDPNVKDNPKDLSQYEIIEPQNDSLVKYDGLSIEINPNKPVIIERWMYAPDYTGTWGFANNQLITFDLKNGVATYVQDQSSPNLILENPALMNPKVNMSNIADTVYTTDTSSAAINTAIGNVRATATTDLYQNKIKLKQWNSDTTYYSSNSDKEFSFKRNYQAEVAIGRTPPKSAVTSVEVVVKKNSTGVNEENAHPEFNVIPIYFPDGRLALHATSNKYGELTQRIYNMSGRMIYQRKMQLYPGAVLNYFIDKGNLGHGVYIVSSELITQEGKKEIDTDKIVVK